MVQLKIKEEHKDAKVGFNNSGAPLGKRSQKDLIDLAIMGHKHNPRFKDFFETLPTLEQLQEAKGEEFNAKVASPTPVKPTAQAPANNNGDKSKK